MLSHQAYGKSRVRLLLVLRPGAQHEPRDLTFDVRLAGDFEPAYSGGDNRRVLPTDTIKNTIYALARLDPPESVPDFAILLARRFLDRLPHVSTARVEVEERPWRRIESKGVPHAHAFAGTASERATCCADVSRDAIRIECGIRGLDLLRTTGSGFAGFLRDEYTTLAETADRVLATSIEAAWAFARPDVDYAAAEESVRRALVETFADETSRSLQQLAYAMGRAVLARCPAIAEIRLRLPNLHHVRVDLGPFGLTNPDEVYAPASEPFGVIEATLQATPSAGAESAGPRR